MATKKLGAVTTAAKKKLEDEAKRAAEEAKRRAQAAATAQKAKQQAQQKASTVAKKAAQTVKAKAAQATKATGTDGHGRSTSVKYVSTRRTSSTLKSATEQVNRALKDAQKAQRRTNEKGYQASGSKFATDWTARQAARTTAFQYSRGEQRKDLERLSSPSKDRPKEVSRFYLRSGTVAPMDLLRADAISGRNPAQTMPAQSQSQKARAAARKKQAEINQQRYAKIPISAEDQKLPETERQAIKEARSAWEKARDAGDLPGMRRAHEIAEAVRYRHGYTGGETGDTPYKPTLSMGERLSMNREGETALRQAMLDADRAIGPTAKKLAAARIEEVKNSDRNKSALQKQRDREEKREEDRRRILSDPSSTQLDAHGRPLALNQDADKMYAGIESVPYRVAGSALTYLEGKEAARREWERDTKRDKWQKLADKLSEYQGELESYEYAIEQYGYDPKGRNKAVLEAKLREAQWAQDQLDQILLDPRSDEFDATLARVMGLPTSPEKTPSERWLEKGNELREYALDGLGPVPRTLAETALSMAENAPALIASAATGSPIPAMVMGGIQAGGQEIYNQRQKGADAKRAMDLGNLKALSEGGWEAVGVGNLVGLATGRIGKPLASALASQFLAESGEEIGTYSTDYLIDRYIAKDPDARFSVPEAAREGLIGGLAGLGYGSVGAIAGMPARGGSNVPAQIASVQTAPIALPASPVSTETARAEQMDTARQRLERTLEQRRAAQTQAPTMEATDLPEAVRQQMNRVRERMAERAAQQEAAEQVLSQATATPVRRMTEPARVRRMPGSDAPSSQREILERNINTLGDSGRRAILSQYRDGEDVMAYRRGFQAVYDQALNGAGDNAIKIPRALDALQARAAADAGRNDLAAQIEREQAAAENARVAKNGGLRDYRQIAQIVGKKQAKILDETARMLGREVRYVSAGEMKNATAQGEERADGIIQINRDYEAVTGDKPDAVRWIMGHELFHTMKRISPEHARAFQDAIMQDEENQRRVEAVLEAYQQNGAEISRAEVMEEIAADISGDIFNEGSDFLERFIARNRGNHGVLSRLWQAIKSMAAKLTGRQKQQADEAMTLLENAMDETAKRVKDLAVGDVTDINVGNKTRHSFAGEKARTANVQRLSEAREMERNGTDNESIRQSTGWHKGRDGKWRFEIDDSQMQYFQNGDARFRQAHPEYAEYQELYQKLFDDTLTDAEHARLEALEDTWGGEIGRLSGRVMRDEATLEDILQHDALFEAYPELRNVRVAVRNMVAGASGNYDRNKNTITLNSRDVRQTQESALIHEIQHAIQQIEVFANGTNPMRAAEALAKARERKIEEINAVQKRLDDYLQGIGLDEFSSAILEKVYQGERSRKEHRALREQFIKESEYGEEIEAAQRKISALREQLSRYGMTGIEAYKRTAGEIEARDTQARRKLTAEERKKTAPDLGGEDTVFAEGDSTSYLIREDENGEKYVDVDVDQHLFDGLTVSEMQTVAKKEILDRFRGKVIGSNYTAYVNKRSAEHYAYPANRRMDVQQKEDKMRASTELDHIIEASTFRENVPDDGRHPEATGGIDKLDTVFQVGGRRYSTEITVLVTDRGRVFYDLTKFKDITGREIGQTQNSAAETSSNAFDNSISREAQKSNTKMSIPTDRIQQIDPREIRPVNEITDREKADYLADTFRSSGWNGRPIVAVNLGNQYTALTGSHRIFAASEAGIPVDAVVLDYSDDIAPLLTANDDETRAKIAKELQEDGTIPDYIADLIVREDDLNWENYDVPYEEQARYSIKSPGVTGQEAAELARENRELRKKLEHWKAQVKRTDRRDVDPKSLRQLARRLRGDYNTEMGADEIAARLGEIYNGISHDMAYEEAREMAQILATDMIEQASVTEDYLYHEYEPMRKYFRETPLVLTPTDQREITDYNDFRKAMMGKLRLKTGERSNVDQVYQELSMLWPEFFDEQRDITSLDQVERIAQVLEDIYRRDDVNPFAGDMAGPANFLASEIMESFWDAPAVKKTFADRAEEKLDKAIAGRARMAQRWHEAVRAREETEMNARWREAELKATYDWLAAKDRHERQQKYAAALKAVREQRDRKLSAQALRHRETVQGMRQRQKERELRARIIRHSRDLSKKLLRPSDNQHVPQGLRGAAAAVLESINLESVYTYDPVTGRRSKDPNGSPAKRTQAFQELRIAYQKIAEAEGLDTLALDPDLMTNITAVESFRDTPISALSLEQLDTVWRTVKAMEASITTANKMLAQSRFASVKDASVALKTDNEHKNQRAQFREAPGRFQKLLGTDMLTPQQYFHRMGKAGDEIFRMLRDAQDKQISLLRETTDDVKEATTGVNTRKLGKEKKTFTFGDEKVTFTKAQIMSLYALMKRPQAVAHILVGGMRPGQYRSGIKESERVDPIRLEQAQIESITNSLTKEEKGVADRLQKILEKRMAAAGNEASMTVYGYEKFGDEHYFPIRTDKNQTVDDQAKGAQAATLPGRGFAQQTKPNASNAVIIDDIFDVVSDHVAEMSTYAAFLPAMEDLKRIFNFRFREEEGGGNVKSIIETVHGKHGTNYWRKLTEDLNNGIQGINDSPFGGLVGAYKASAIGANLRVMIQQPTAILRALDEVNPADLIAAAGSVTPGAWERAKRYSPIAEWKSWGYFDAYTGRTVRDILFEDGDGLNRANNFLMSGAGAMDSLAWTHLWRALEIETKRMRKDLTPKTEEFYQAVAERFNRVIDRTQVVDGILQRSQIMRSPDGLTKMATSFMAEPTKVYNMLTGAAYDARNAATAAERKQAVGRLARTALALTTSVSVNAAMQSVVDALRDDDNDETYLEKFLQAFLGIGEDAKDEREERKNYIFSNLAEGFNPVNFVPFVRDLWSLVQGYSVDRMDMEAIGGLVSEGQNMMKALEGGGKITTANATMRMIGELGRLVGVPAANIKRDSLAIVQTILRGTGSYKPLFEISKFLYRIDNPNNANTFLDIIYAARRAGDMEAYWDLSDELMTTLGKDEKWLEGKMTSRLAEDGNLAGIEAEQFRMFSQQVGNIKGDENGTKQENIISYIDGLDLSDEQKSALFRTQYDSDKNNPWA